MKKKASEKKAPKKGGDAPKVKKEVKVEAVKKKVAAKKKAAPKRKAAAPKIEEPGGEPAAVAKKRAAAPKAVAKKATTKLKVPKAYTEDEIRIAAFYVYEERSATGSPGDPAGDWNEAIRRLKARDKK